MKDFILRNFADYLDMQNIDKGLKDELISVLDHIFMIYESLEGKTEKLKNAINTISKTLKNDEGYYIGWKSNIAMAFVDTFKENFVNTSKEDLENVHKVANNAADRFLDLLIKNDEYNDNC